MTGIIASVTPSQLSIMSPFISTEKFPVTGAKLLGNFSEALLYGLYLVSFYLCGYTLLFTGSGRDARLLRPCEIRWMMVFIALILFCTCTFDVAIGLLNNYQAFVVLSDVQGELTSMANWMNISPVVNQFIAILVGDFVLIYRCWIVHGRRWLVIVPSLILYFSSIAMTIKPLQEEMAKYVEEKDYAPRPWVLSFYAITVVQNILTTSILIWRIWRVDSENSKYLSHTDSVGNPPRHLRKVIRIIAESGTAYTLMLLLTFIVMCTPSNASYVISSMTLQTVGIAFNVILIRASAGRERQFTEFDHNERMVTPGVMGRGVARNATIGSLKFSRQPHGGSFSVGTSEDLEMGVQPTRSHMDESSEMDIDPGGITVTEVVHS